MSAFDEFHAIPPQLLADGWLARVVHGERLTVAEHRWNLGDMSRNGHLAAGLTPKPPACVHQFSGFGNTTSLAVDPYV